MALKRLGAMRLYSQICVSILAVTLALPSVVHSQIAPNREIVSLDAADTPAWKMHWDSARNFVRLGDYDRAVRSYKELLQRKPQIEEAKWEYCKVLIELDRNDEASMLLESLIEANPYNKEYLVVAGYTALKTEDYDRAVRYLGQVYAMDPGGSEGVNVLRALIEGLTALGKNEYAFVLMEQLRQRTPEDIELLHKLAKNAYELGYIDKAGDFYSSLLLRDKGSYEQVREAAEMFTATGSPEKAAPLWKTLIQHEPNNLHYHKRLVDYYRQKKSNKEILFHLLAIIDIEGKSAEPDLLLEVARNYTMDQGRADKGLRYYERYLKVRPNDAVARSELSEARRILADDLLSIVENDRAEPLWNDLKAVTDDRLVIYRLMANSLEREKKETQLIQVLEIIYQQPGGNNDETALRLADLYNTGGNSRKAYQYLIEVDKNEYLTYEYYIKRADIERGLGYDVDALVSLSQALDKRPSNLELREDCITLAGQLGFLERLHAFAAPLLSPPLAEQSFSLYKSYLEGLKLNGQYIQAMSLSSQLLKQTWVKNRDDEDILLFQASLLKAMDKRFAAQQLLRSQLVDGNTDSRVVLALVESALDNASVEDGLALIRYYSSLPGNENWQAAYDVDHWKLFQAYIHLLSLQGEADTAIDELKAYIAGVPQGDKHRSIRTMLDLELCNLYIAADDNEQCQIVIDGLRRRGENSLQVRFTERLLVDNGNVDPELLIKDVHGGVDVKGGVSDLFTLTDQAEYWGKPDVALAFVGEILHLQPESMRAKIKKAELLKSLGRSVEASLLYHELWRDDLQQTTYYHQYLLLEFRKGNYTFVLGELAKKDFTLLPIELKLLKARTLWATNDRDQALLLYKEMLEPSVSNRFRQSLAEENLQFTWEKKQKQAFWEMFNFEQPDQLDILNSFQEKDGFLSRLKTPVGEITADLYDSYRWEKLISSEYKVRQDVMAYKFLAAEKQYRKNIKEEQSTAGLKDLARIYERLGDYDKEAEVYSYLEKQGENTPELEESIERNRIARAPVSAVNFSYLEKDGRDGLINLRKISTGSSFTVNPSLNSSFQVEFAELFYNTARGPKEEVDGRILGIRGNYAFNDKTDIDVGFAYHMLDTEADSAPLTDVRLTRHVDDLLSGFLEFRHALIDDTLEALDESLTTNSVATGIIFEGANGVNIGGEFQHLWYEGSNNDQNSMYFWSSYSLFSELTTYELKYSYEILKNSESDTKATDTVEKIVLPYWSPGEYWQHLFTFRVLNLLQRNEDAERPPSSYSFNFSLGYESEENFTYMGSFDIFLEISDNYLLKGEVLYTDGNEYEEKSAVISLMYRW